MITIDLSQYGKGLVAHRYIKDSAPSKMPHILDDGDFSWHLSQERSLTNEDISQYNRSILRPVGRMLTRLNKLINNNRSKKMNYFPTDQELIEEQSRMNNEIHGSNLKEMIESTGSPQGSRAYDELAIVFVEAPDGQVREQWFTPTCGHAIEQEDCPSCLVEQEYRDQSRSRFYA